MKSDNFTKFLNVREKRSRKWLKAVVCEFLGNSRAYSDEELIEAILRSFKIMYCTAEYTLNLMCYILIWTNSKIVSA